ncbi:MAG: 4-hydroxythreonine-4-phosphate dehydrogenase PdxA [Nitrospiraceae bacterium]|nr:4-hydroxythreonine-4-phosphate dehydrogenase PdxA [Nitrospiraceae bacterium]
MSRKKKIAFTSGDPAGIGPEIMLRAALSDDIRSSMSPVLVCDSAVLQMAMNLLSVAELPQDISLIHPDSINLIEIAQNKPSSGGGAIAAGSIRKAVELAMNKEVDAIVTAPISKESLHLAGLPWPGHTEMLAELTCTKDFAMMLTGGPLRVILVTIHESLLNAVRMINSEAVFKTINMAQRACKMFGIDAPRIAVAALNPHAGESGMFGNEEQEHILPAVSRAKEAGYNVSGPLPADTLFHKAYRGDFDIIVCMYHDQGLIPLKMIAFDTGVNITVGLPIIRTSPDHGTAFDIAWTAKADPSSMIEAALTASRLKIQ